MIAADGCIRLTEVRKRQAEVRKRQAEVRKRQNEVRRRQNEVRKRQNEVRRRQNEVRKTCALFAWFVRCFSVAVHLFQYYFAGGCAFFAYQLQGI